MSLSSWNRLMSCMKLRGRALSQLSAPCRGLGPARLSACGRQIGNHIPSLSRVPPTNWILILALRIQIWLIKTRTHCTLLSTCFMSGHVSPRGIELDTHLIAVHTCKGCVGIQTEAGLCSRRVPAHEEQLALGEIAGVHRNI